MSFAIALWLPILVSAVIVFILSAASHMALPWRRNEWRHVPRFAAVQDAVKDLPPGLYAFPAAESSKEQMSQEWMDRWAAGPSGWITLVPRGPINMGRNLGLSFLVFLLISFLNAYVAYHALGPAPAARTVFRIVSTVGVLSYGASAPFNSIWYARPWKSMAADLLDAVVFGLAMGAVFGWLWPR